MKAHAPLPVTLFSTAPQSVEFEGGSYGRRLSQVACWSEEAGCTGILIYSDNSLIGPWLAAQIVIQSTRHLCPLVAVQPVYMHPYSAAKMVASLAYLHGRKIYLNMIAGGFRTDLYALCDETPHDQRYERLEEYTRIVLGLLSSGERPFSFAGSFYRVKDLVMRPPLPPDLLPPVLVSGSSEAGKRAAKALGATAVEYPKSGDEYPYSEARENAGMRIGVIAAERSDQAWEKAHRRFPGDRAGQLRHLVAMRVSDSYWHKQLSQMEREPEPSGIYWLWPFKNYNTFCPYLVGNWEEVAEEVAKYIRAGFTNYILDIPAEESDLHCAGIVFRMATQKAAATSCAGGSL